MVASRDMSIISFFDAWHTSLADVSKARRKRSSDIAGLEELEWKEWDNIDLNDNKESTAAVSNGAAAIKEQLAQKDASPNFGVAVLALFDYEKGWSGTWDILGDARMAWVEVA